jgi:Flp pilus assembly protein TadB
MAQTRKKRKSKHRGTQAGNIETPSHRSTKTARASSGGGTKTRARRQMKPPSLRGAAIKAAAAAAVFAVLSATLFSHKGGAGTIVVTVLFVFAIYLPVAYWTDKATYKRRQAKAQAGK